MWVRIPSSSDNVRNTHRGSCRWKTFQFFSATTWLHWISVILVPLSVHKFWEYSEIHSRRFAWIMHLSFSSGEIRKASSCRCSPHRKSLIAVCRSRSSWELRCILYFISIRRHACLDKWNHTACRPVWWIEDRSLHVYTEFVNIIRYITFTTLGNSSHSYCPFHWVSCVHGI